MTTPEKQRTNFIPAPEPLSFGGMVRSEFIKLTSLRSSMALLFAIMVFGVGVSAALTLTMADAGLPAAPSVGFMLDQVTLGTVLFGQLLAALLGVLAISGEYATGTIHSTLIAAPARVPVLAAKTIVLFSATTTSALVAVFGSWALTYPLFASYGLQIGLMDAGVTVALIGAGVYVGLSAILGVGVGALLRGIAAGVATAISLILVFPIVLSVLPASPMVRDLHLLSMSKAGDAMSNAAETGGVFVNLTEGYVSSGAGWVIAAAWAAAFFVLGAIRLRRGDA